MDRIRRNERMAALTKILTTSPNRIFTLSHFCDLFGAAKSTMSEDIDILKDVLTTFELGKLDTVTGAAGGVRFRPAMGKAEAKRIIHDLCEELMRSTRLLPGGFLYLTDILSTPSIVRSMGVILAGQFYDTNPDFVLTMETKGIPVALMTADALGVPLVIARHTSNMFEGSAVHINYETASAGHIETMSLSRRAVQPGQKALIVDDFIKGGGTAKGMTDLMGEFGAEVVGMAFVVATATPTHKRVQGEKALMLMDVVQGETPTLHMQPADWLVD
ncbi:MAG: pur operon repressor [Candidatus Limiplasma sp.]|nr:pur operon repressor [Candidatus Limiplasma sp.]MEA5146139.1 pur operon repressor [Candidatus Limiplasma sp.]